MGERDSWKNEGYCPRGLNQNLLNFYTIFCCCNFGTMTMSKSLSERG